MRVVVVGAGLLGVSTAYFLAKNGHRVTVLDRATDAAQETSYANGGILTPSMADPWNAPGVWRLLLKYLGKEDSPFLLRPKAMPSLVTWGLTFLWHSGVKRFRANTSHNVRLCSYSMSVLGELERELSLAYDQGPGGTIKIFRDKAAFDAVLNMAAFLGEFGVRYEIVDANGAIEKEPALKPVAQDIAAGIFYPDDGSGDARLFTLRLAEAAKKLGVAFEFGVTVEGAARQGREVRSVRTSVGDYAADAVVIAAGSYSGRVARAFGGGVPVRPVKGYSITTPLGGWKGGPKIPVIDDHFHAVVTPLGERLRVGGTAEFAGYDARLTPSRIDNLKRFVVALFPDYALFMKEGAIEPWCGFRPMSADGVPIMGRGRLENVFFNTGHGHLGWTMAAGAGRMVADLMSGRESAIDPQPYRPLRF
ncbi:MAG: D-amino acid dehydrogenase [Sphingomonadales bacterium]|nr:D-amino acid dehydrogenase [Sphingomonadales bacterium]